MKDKAEAVAKQLTDGYGVYAYPILVDGIWYVVYSGNYSAVPAMINGIWIRRSPWPK